MCAIKNLADERSVFIIEVFRACTWSDSSPNFTINCLIIQIQFGFKLYLVTNFSVSAIKTLQILTHRLSIIK